MALKANPITCAYAVLSHPRLGTKSSTCGLNFRKEFHGLGNGVCCRSVFAQRAITPAEDEKPFSSGAGSSDGISWFKETGSTGFHKDLNSLPNSQANDRSGKQEAGQRDVDWLIKESGQYAVDRLRKVAAND